MTQRLGQQVSASASLRQLPAQAGAAGGGLAERVLALQRTAGNAAVGRRLASLRAPRTLARATPGLFAPPTGFVGAPRLPPPGTPVPSLPGLAGGLRGLRWVTTAVETAESVAAGTGVTAAGATTVVEGGVTVGGAALGPGAMVAAESSVVAAGAVTTGEAAMVGGLAIAPEATVVLAGTATATGTTAGVGTAGVAGGAALLTPAGWVVVGVIVVGLAVGATVYLVMRSYDGEANAGAPLAGSGRPGKGSMAPPPRIAPGAGRSDPIVEPDRGAPALVPGLPGSSIAEPEESFPLEAPGSRASEPLELASKRLPPLIDPLHGSGLPGIPPPAVYQSADELREALRNALRATTFGPSDGQSLIDDVRAVIRSGQLPRTPANDILVSMLEDVYRKLGDGAGRRFRQAIANAQGPDVPETARNGRLKPFPWAAWDAVYDVEYGNQINRPETLGQILQQHLGLPRWVP